MKRLLALLAGVLALVLGSVSMALAAAPASSHGSAVSAAAHATYASGRDLGAAVSAIARSHGLEVSTAARAKHDSTDTETTTEAPTSDSTRPHNHGWFVSQVAKDHSVTGKAHGAAVSAVARSDQGKASHSGH